MFQIKTSITASLALVVFLTSSVAFAEGDVTATAPPDTAAAGAVTATAGADTATASTDAVKPAPKKKSKKKSAKATPKPVTPAADTSAPPSDASTPPKSDTSAQAKSEVSASGGAALTPVKSGTDDSPEAIQQRSGPGNPVAGKEKSELCQGCHGEEGVSAEGFAPKLAGQYSKYIAKQLRNFQAGTRVHQIMSAIAATISDDDLADIAAYFASRNKMKGEGSNNKLGEQLFLHGDMSRMMVACVNCHGVNGKGKTPTNPVFPVIGGQHKDYIRGQLINFRAGDRSNSPGGVMNIITQKLTDAELDALADYVSGL